MGGASVLMVAVGVLVVAVITSSSGGSGIELTPAEGLTVQDIYRNVTAATRRDGEVLHVILTGSFTIGNITSPPDWHSDLWIDASRQFGRMQDLSGFTGDRAPTLFIGGRSYHVTRSGEDMIPMSADLTCAPGIGVEGLLVGACDSRGPGMTEVLTGKYDGREVVVLRTTRPTTNEDGEPTGESTVEVYLDPEVWLPIANPGEARTLSGQLISQAASELSYEWIQLENLPDDTGAAPAAL